MSRPNGDRPAEILQRLIRFDTTNPPGNERECVRYVADLLESAGLETVEYATSKDRPNLVEEHPDVFTGVRYAVGEFGGFPPRVTSRRSRIRDQRPVPVDRALRGVT